MTSWHYRAVCPCGWHTEAPFGDFFHVHYDCCPKCGKIKTIDRFRHNWTIKTMRYVSNVVWWKPSTWGNGYWETK